MKRGRERRCHYHFVCNYMVLFLVGHEGRFLSLQEAEMFSWHGGEYQVSKGSYFHSLSFCPMVMAEVVRWLLIS